MELTASCAAARIISAGCVLLVWRTAGVSRHDGGVHGEGESAAGPERVRASPGALARRDRRPPHRTPRRRLQRPPARPSQRPRSRKRGSASRPTRPGLSGRRIAAPTANPPTSCDPDRAARTRGAVAALRHRRRRARPRRHRARPQNRRPRLPRTRRQSPPARNTIETEDRDSGLPPRRARHARRSA